ncbi:MAG TPA: SurA N-terminal domain-containing protein [Bdellovibrio sp.]|uniref:SurA N-terminal domain-containing protein n=1 Tax=Bdellovibrio sp. TaxID=28201 RepID=UPI002F1B3A21
MSNSMADSMRRKLSGKNATAIVLFGAIILVFVFFGYQGKLGGSVGSVARVNNTLISIADFQQEENRVQQYYQNLFGSSVDFSSQRQLLRQQALENLVHSELVSQSAKKEGILATDAEVRDFIVKDIPFFQQNGQFQREFYTRYLEATHSSAGDFENKVRKDIANVRIRHLFELAGKPSALELKKLQDLRSNKINVQFVKIDQEAISKAMTKEKAEAALKDLDDALAKGDEAAVNAKLKEIKASWEETGFTEIGADSFPKITSQVANEAIFELTKAQPLLKRLVRDGNTKYILKLKETKVEEAKSIEPTTVEMTQKRRADGLFESWINQFRANSNITMNPQALQQ